MMLGAIIGTIAIVLVTIAIGLYVERKTKLLPKPEELAATVRPKRPATHGLGEAPATALRCGQVQLVNLRKGQRCTACRAAMTHAESVDDHVRYNERDLIVLHFTCPSCPTRKSLYVEPTTSTSRPS